MKILLYGFKPYGKFSKNVSEEIVLWVAKNKPKIFAVVFPVEFDKQMLIKQIAKHKPDIIIGTGQHPRARKIRLERRAINQLASKTRSPQKIDRVGKQTITSTLKLQPSGRAYLSYNAGQFVCNFSMYVIGQWAEKHSVPYTFIHFPRKISPKKGAQFLEKLIKSPQS